MSIFEDNNVLCPILSPEVFLNSGFVGCVRKDTAIKSPGASQDYFLRILRMFSELGIQRVDRVGVRHAVKLAFIPEISAKFKKSFDGLDGVCVRIRLHLFGCGYDGLEPRKAFLIRLETILLQNRTL